VDLREQTLTVSGQEILSSDNLPLRVSATVRWKITDALAWKRGGANTTMRIYEAAQLVLRRRIGARTLDAALADRAALDEGLATELGTELTSLGIVILGASMRDITLVGVAKQAYADLWRAQKEGLAALERARGEQAALRALANAARMLKGNPELMNLRVLQALQGGPGKTAPSVILGGAPGLVPVSKEAAPPENASE
jgi:regulator of protease activity HflC (stomatin/prohibitin superfamily)